MTSLNKDFVNYAKSRGISSLRVHGHTKQIENTITPYVLEERQMNVTQIDVFSRLMLERIIWLAGPIDSIISPIIQAQLMFLDSIGSSDIILHIDSPGGCIKSGLSIIDVMEYIRSDVNTINTGMAASMGAVLLGAGTVGKRSSLRFSRTMIHQSSTALEGTYKDASIAFDEWGKTNELIFRLLGEYTKKDPEIVKKDADRDLWMNSEETLKYGLIDEIIINRK
jgi:ATP-dependent Clp protease protease subunit